MGLQATLGASACCLLTFLLTLGSLTGGLQHWTFESSRRQAARDQALRAPPLQLMADDGHRWRAFDPVSSKEREPPRAQVVGFIYTSCESICQALGSEFGRMQEQLRATGAPVQLLSVSIDIERDNRAALASYARLHRADPKFWTIAVPTDEEQLHTLLQAIGVVTVPDGLGGFAHNGSIHVIDRQGRVRSIHDWEDWEGAMSMARSLANAAQQ